MSGTIEKRLFNSRFEILISALDREIPLLPFPPDFKRVYDAEEEHDVILDDALADCMSLLRQLRYRKPLDRMRHFLNLRTLARQLIALRFWASALTLSIKLIALLHDFRIYLPSEFLLDLIVAYATHALLLGANSQLPEAQTACERALTLTKQLGKEANTHPIYPLIHRIAAYFVDDITPRLNYLLEAARYYKSILPSSLELYTLPCAETLSSIGRCYLKQQKPLLAIGVLEEANQIFCSTPSAPPDDLIICFIRLGRAFQATGQLSRANEVLARAYHALECAKETSLNELLARVRQEHGIPSSVSAQSDPVIMLPSVYRAEYSIANSRTYISHSTSSFLAATF
jgi:tetratricopeptide (TPR) repeat protein